VYNSLYLLITAATIDRVASETLAKVEEKCPIITKTPTEVRCLGLLPFLHVTHIYFGGYKWLMFVLKLHSENIFLNHFKIVQNWLKCFLCGIEVTSLLRNRERKWKGISLKDMLTVN